MPRARRFGRAAVAAALAASAATVMGIGLLALERETKPWRLAAANATADGNRIAELLGGESGATVAEIGAGQGRMTVAVAQRLSPASHVFSTELGAARIDDLRKTVAASRLTNITVVPAGERDTNLPAHCCDAIFMSLVYHHFEDRIAMNTSLRRSLRPGGLLLVIDYAPRDWPTWVSWLRGNAGQRRDGVSRSALTSELTETGFRVERVFERWSHWPDRRYGVLFRNAAIPRN